MQMNQNTYELKEILIEEGWSKTAGKLATMFGLGTALAFGGTPEKSISKPSSIKVSTVKKTMPVANQNTGQTNTVVSTNVPTSMIDFIGSWEGIKSSVYKDHKGNPTIGIGHYLNNTKQDRELISKLFSNEVDYDALLKGKQTLTSDQIKTLFQKDVENKEKLATKLMPNYNNFNQETKNAIVNALYRGDIGPKTIGHINKNNWTLAAKEYLNHKNAKNGPDQVKRRMKTNAAIFRKNQSS